MRLFELKNLWLASVLLTLLASASVLHARVRNGTYNEDDLDKLEVTADYPWCDAYCCDYLCEFLSTKETEAPVTCPPPEPQTPKFTKNIYQTSLPSWPAEGTVLALGIGASTPNHDPIEYSLLSSFEFIELAENQTIVFTSSVDEGAFVGPNNVMIVEVIAELSGWGELKSSSATVAVVFPKPRANNYNNNNYNNAANPA